MSGQGETPFFERYCRRPGTRCAQIMRLIDEGLTDEEIANKIKHTPDKARGVHANRECDAVTISVYRKAHDGTLTPPSGEAFRSDSKAATEEQARRMREAGMTVRAISEALGISQDRAGHYVRGVQKGSAKLKDILADNGMDEAEALRLMIKYGDDKTIDAIIRQVTGKKKEETK